MISLLILAILAATTVWAQSPMNQSALPAELRGVGVDQHPGAQISSAATFRDEAGRQVKLGEYFGKRPIVLALVYYQCPMLCTEILNGMVRSLRTMSLTAGKDFDVLSVSIDPSESPALARNKKEQYVRRYNRAGSDSGWHFLTGTEASIHSVAQTAGFHYTYNPQTKLFAHPSAIMVVTPEGRISRYFFGVEYEPRDLRLGLVESSREKIGSPVDQVLLFCYHYDPASGKYTMAVQQLMRIGAALTLGILGWFWIILWRGSQSQRAIRGVR